MQGGDEPSTSAGDGHQRHGRGGGGGGKQHKRHKPHHKASHRPTAAPGPAVDLPLPEGGTHIDGSMLEGGGQILRNASALAAILGKLLKVDKIRAGRDKPGLRPQHLTGLQVVAALCGGQLLGGEVGSLCITLSPGPLVCSHHTADTKTAGSCTLLAQSALPCLLFAATGQPAAAGDASSAAAGAAGAAGEAEAAALQAAVQGGTASELDLRGGTDAAMAPPAGYMQHVLLPTLRRRLGVHATMQLVRRGFFPRGQGQVQLTVERLPPGACLPAINLTERGEIVSLAIRAFTAGRVVPSVGERLVDAARKAVTARLPRCGVPRSVPISCEVVHDPPERAFSDGCGLLVTAESSTGCLWGASGLGERGVRAEDIGQRAGDELMDALEVGACTDEWLQDQLVIFMALAQGRSRVLTGEPTLHTRTACMVAEALTGARFTVAPAPAAPGQAQRPGLWLIECEGAAVAAPS
ncbi:RNA 3 -terminal phosphate cyclase [Chlorella sorokiniana]|uniref:RNA 3-terminal phosphate cyclase n=1 Tax=Chlorella sorokiniana TaxID=3076 RepID=A0A2P6U0W3_CHLSO|nr:RNA 3 -terminal phosphate cyclase [Chlorella sorokiniana]|eukprot:PRW59938.1 RNA 3 -terminal phosphate cyclase [Chlorella sorokiniana]